MDGPISIGAFNNYVDQILPNFDHLEWTIIDILHTTFLLFIWKSVHFLLATYPPLLVHIVIEWPQSSGDSLIDFHLPSWCHLTWHFTVCACWSLITKFVVYENSTSWNKLECSMNLNWNFEWLFQSPFFIPCSKEPIGYWKWVIKKYKKVAS